MSKANGYVVLNSLLPVAALLVGTAGSVLTAAAYHASRNDNWNNKLLYYDFCCDAMAGLSCIPVFLLFSANNAWPQYSLGIIWLLYFVLFVANALLGVGGYLQMAEVLSSSASVFRVRSLVHWLERAQAGHIVVASLAVSGLFEVVENLLGNYVQKGGERYHLRSTQFYFTDAYAFISDVKVKLEYGVKSVAYLMTIVLTIRLIAQDKSKSSHEAAQTRALAVMVCIQTLTILLLDTIDVILASVYNSFPNISECKPFEEQLRDFDAFWPHLFSESARNLLDVMRVGYYFFPAILFDRLFRQALCQAIAKRTRLRGATVRAMETATGPVQIRIVLNEGEASVNVQGGRNGRRLTSFAHAEVLTSAFQRIARSSSF